MSEDSLSRLHEFILESKHRTGRISPSEREELIAIPLIVGEGLLVGRRLTEAEWVARYSGPLNPSREDLDRFYGIERPAPRPEPERASEPERESTPPAPTEPEPERRAPRGDPVIRA